jgi:hypothetical protein
VTGAAGPEQSASVQPMMLTLALSGDRVMVENVILEVRALAQKLGLGISDVAVIGKPAIVPKKAIAESGPTGHEGRDGSATA